VALLAFIRTQYNKVLSGSYLIWTSLLNGTGTEANNNGDQLQLRSALQVISDLILIQPEYVVQFIQQTLTQIKGVLQNSMLHLDCKLRAIETLGDICSASEE
jgi:hypothetical protein